MNLCIKITYCSCMAGHLGALAFGLVFKICLIWFTKIVGYLMPNLGWLVGFYGISTSVGYLTPNPFLYEYSVLFQSIQFSRSTQFNCQKRFYFKLFSLVKQF